jgi:hypothetical protein
VRQGGRKGGRKGEREEEKEGRRHTTIIDCQPFSITSRYHKSQIKTERAF